MCSASRWSALRQSSLFQTVKHNAAIALLPLAIRKIPKSLMHRRRCILRWSQKQSGHKDAISLDSAIWALALPALGTELIDPLLSACDVAFVGRLGPLPLAGVGIASSVFTYTFLFFNFLSTALSPFVAQSLARCGDHASTSFHAIHVTIEHRHAIYAYTTSKTRTECRHL